MTNILHITNNDYDGAGRAVVRLNDNINKRGAKSKILVLYKKTNNEEIISIGTGMTFKEILSHILKNKFLCNFIIYVDLIKKFFFSFSKFILVKIYKPKNLFNFDRSIYNLKKIEPYLDNVDLIIFHSIQEIISYNDIAKLYKIFGIKIVFHPLDMEMITGGYHFNYDCKCYMTGKCNSKNHNMEKLSEKNYKKKIFLLSKIPITWVAANNFVLKRINSSKIFSLNHNIQTVFFGIDKNIYKPFSKDESRNKLNIDINKKIILFGCFDFMDKRKGAFILKRIIKVLNNSKYKKENILIVTYGDLKSFDVDNEFIEWKHFGYINSLVQMNLLYRASDVMINPSLDDMGPTTLQEAFLNDLFIVSFDMGLARDLIFDNINGYIIKNFDVDDFTNKTITKLIEKNYFMPIDHENINKLKIFCNPDFQAKKFLEIID